MSNGPRIITLVRHGESLANVAEAVASAAGLSEIGLNTRDADAGLSPLGRGQAQALAQWVTTAPARWRPSVVFTSPYLRARQTARPTLDVVGLESIEDERLRERDLGIFEGVTIGGMSADFPVEARRRAELGKFYYRPPGGESWTDVMMRVRTFLHDLRHLYHRERVWIVAHRATIMSFRAVLENLGEAEVLRIDDATPLPNASLTRYVRREDRYVLDAYADPVAQRVLDGEESNAPVIAGTDATDRLLEDPAQET